MRKRDLAVVPLVAGLLLGLTACPPEKHAKSPVPAAPQGETINQDDGFHEFSGFGKWKYGKKLNPSAKWAQCKWRVEVQSKETKRWYTQVSGGAGHSVTVERSPNGNAKRLFSQSCGRWH